MCSVGKLNIYTTPQLTCSEQKAWPGGVWIEWYVLVDYDLAVKPQQYVFLLCYYVTSFTLV